MTVSEDTNSRQVFEKKLIHHGIHTLSFIVRCVITFREGYWPAAGSIS